MRQEVTRFCKHVREFVGNDVEFSEPALNRNRVEQMEIRFQGRKILVSCAEILASSRRTDGRRFAVTIAAGMLRRPVEEIDPQIFDETMEQSVGRKDFLKSTGQTVEAPTRAEMREEIERRLEEEGSGWIADVTTSKEDTDVSTDTRKRGRKPRSRRGIEPIDPTA